ncbi:MAG: transcriptional regulator, partial [Dermatophilaceae bacterium]|nr:transcriptional regulator [Dermatophilaceae bacterium]
VGSHVQRLATIAHGDGVCTTHIPGQLHQVTVRDN